MQISKCSSSSSLDLGLRRMAAIETMSKVALKRGTSWSDAKPLIEASLVKAAEIGPFEEEDVAALLRKLAANGVKIGDGSPEAIKKEAQGFMGWMGQQMGNAGNWLANKGKGIQEYHKNKPLNDAKNNLSSAIGQVSKAIFELGKVDPNLAGQFKQLLEAPMAQVRGQVQQVAGESQQPQQPAAGQSGQQQQFDFAKPQPGQQQTFDFDAAQQAAPQQPVAPAPVQPGQGMLDFENAPGAQKTFDFDNPNPAAPAVPQKPLGMQRPQPLPLNSPQYQNATPEQRKMMLDRRNESMDPIRQKIREHNKKKPHVNK